MDTTLTGPSRTPDPIAAAWGDELRRHRREHDLTQVQLAELLGIHQTTVSQIERGTLVPSASLQRTIFAECSFDDDTIVRLVRGAA